MKASVFFDLDGTVVKYDGWKGPAHIGTPIPSMFARMRQYLDEGFDVRIFTARVFPLNMCVMPDTELPESGSESVMSAVQAVHAIQNLCKLHLGVVIPVTNVKDYSMVLLFDDRCIQVVPNTGEIIGPVPKIRSH